MRRKHSRLFNGLYSIQNGARKRIRDGGSVTRRRMVAVYHPRSMRVIHHVRVCIEILNLFLVSPTTDISMDNESVLRWWPDYPDYEFSRFIGDKVL